MMCLPGEPKAKVGKRKSEGRMNRWIAFLSLLLWECHRRPPSPFSLFYIQLGINLLMQRLLHLLVQADQQMQNCISAVGSTLSQSTRLSRWMVYLFVISIYSVHFPPTAGTARLSAPSWGISVYCCGGEQTPYAPELASTARFHSHCSPILTRLHTTLWITNRDGAFQTRVLKQSLYTAAPVLIKPIAIIIILATSRLPWETMVVNPCWIVWIIAMTGW